MKRSRRARGVVSALWPGRFSRRLPARRRPSAPARGADRRGPFAAHRDGGEPARPDRRDRRARDRQRRLRARARPGESRPSASAGVDSVGLEAYSAPREVGGRVRRRRSCSRRTGSRCGSSPSRSPRRRSGALDAPLVDAGDGPPRRLREARRVGPRRRRSRAVEADEVARGPLRRVPGGPETMEAGGGERGGGDPLPLDAPARPALPPPGHLGNDRAAPDGARRARGRHAPRAPARDGEGPAGLPRPEEPRRRSVARRRTSSRRSAAATSPDEIVLLGAHLDSWDLGTGALDNGVNCALVVEVARALAPSGPGRARTVRFVLFTGGGDRAARARAATSRATAASSTATSAVLIHDIGDGRITRLLRQRAAGPDRAALRRARAGGRLGRRAARTTRPSSAPTTSTSCSRACPTSSPTRRRSDTWPTITRSRTRSTRWISAKRAGTRPSRPSPSSASRTRPRRPGTATVARGGRAPPREERARRPDEGLSASGRTGRTAGAGERRTPTVIRTLLIANRGRDRRARRADRARDGDRGRSASTRRRTPAPSTSGRCRARSRLGPARRARRISRFRACSRPRARPARTRFTRATGSFPRAPRSRGRSRRPV